jgi:aerobic carbon-monoxide dehydrogenase medium subunit
VKPARFEYHDPTTIDECVAILGRHGDDAKPLAGGQSLVPMMNLRLATPTVLVDLNRIPELAYIRQEEGTLRVGAMTRHRDVAASEVVARAAPLLAHAAIQIGYPPIRARGTIGGSIAHADPVAEMPSVAVALDAELVLVGAPARRVVPAAEFFYGYFATAIAAGEVLVEIRYPVIEPGTGWSFEELARKPGDYAVVAVAAQVSVAGGVVTDARIVLAGVADRPVRASAAEDVLVGHPALDNARLTTAATAAVGAAREGADHRDRSFERHVAGVLTRRALDAAIRRAGGGT